MLFAVILIGNTLPYFFGFNCHHILLRTMVMPIDNINGKGYNLV